MTQEELKQWVNYNPETGIFTWLKIRVPNQTKIGDRAGWIGKGKGYTTITLNGKHWKASRLAWFYMTGVLPQYVDHINGIRSDDRWDNLREVTLQQNNQNQRKPRTDSSTGVLGAYRMGNRYRSKITVNGKTKYLGLYKTIEEAHEAYLAAKRQLHEGNTL